MNELVDSFDLVLQKLKMMLALGSQSCKIFYRLDREVISNVEISLFKASKTHCPLSYFLR